MIFDYRRADLPPADRALCDYAARLTLVPGEMGQADVDRLRRHGFSDEQITIAAQVIGYFNYINRIADGLGVEPADWMTPPREQWEREKGQGYPVACPTDD